MHAPLILTLALHPDDQARFDALRQRHFPPERNHIAAHVTLFHHLPGDDPGVLDVVRLAAAHQPGMAVAVDGLRSLGRGVAFALSGAPLVRLRAQLARHWHDTLTPQDRQGWRPHITIQNKVSPAEATALLASMQAQFVPFSLRATGLELWRYLGGPWEPVETCPFAAHGPPGGT